MRRLLYAGICALGLFAGGCVSNRTLDSKLNDIRDKHGVSIEVRERLWTRCALSGNVMDTLDRVDKTFDAAPEYFKRNVGTIEVESWFWNNPEMYPGIIFCPLNAGATNMKNGELHLKSRNLLERAVYTVPYEDVFPHEATHSFIANAIFKDQEILNEFSKDWFAASKQSWHCPASIVDFAHVYFKPLLYVRPKGHASMLGIKGQHEDIAECGCYLLKHNFQYEEMKQKDRVLYEKLRVMEKAMKGKYDMGR